jgi:hypothetical protein
VATDQVISVHDPDTRHVHKTVRQPTDGYKAHVAVEVDTGLITDCARRQGQRRRNPEVTRDWSGWPARIPGLQVLADSAYGAAEARIALPEAGHPGVIEPNPQRTPVEDRFTRDDFIRRRDRRPGHLPRRRGSRCPDCSLQAELHHRTTGPPFHLARHTTTTRGCSPHADKPKRQIPNHLPTTRPMVERCIAWLAPGQPKTVLRRHDQKGLVAVPPVPE